MTKEEWTFDRIRERQPNFDRIYAALDEFGAGRPVTQRTVDTNEPIFVISDPARGGLFVRTAQRLLAHFKYSPDNPRLQHGTKRVSTFHDPQTGETIGPRQPEPRGLDKPATDRSSSG